MPATQAPAMEKVAIGDHELAYREVGAGPPVVLVHGGLSAEMLAPVQHAVALSGCRRVLYHRQGHGQSPRAQQVRPLTLDDQGADLVGLLDHLDIGAAHLVGHSLGALVALTAAASHADRVASLCLLEPPVPLSHPAGVQWLRSVLPAAEKYVAGDVEGAVSGFYDATLQPGWRARMDRVAPDAFRDSVDGAAMAFGSDLPGLTWDDGLTADQMAAVRCPVRTVVGTDTRPVFRAAPDVLQTWFPWCDSVDVPDADHMLALQAPDPVAAAVADIVHGIETSRCERS
ncbi:alpha/beta fold hydrolase [Serinicoccus kebangsaanensis]|uniref:alpha/beta fold hydrolase n=1 Tax=Serinicoccus kebangsaanensis TaxID=2602069 RepID=UPI00178C3F9A|nr:alpha/beta hydrolase [Serinicoccus kebangsaanensis]